MLKHEVNNFINNGLNGYCHKEYTTVFEGEEICEFILILIDEIEGMKDKISKLETEIERMEYREQALS